MRFACCLLLILGGCSPSPGPGVPVPRATEASSPPPPSVIVWERGDGGFYVGPQYVITLRSDAPASYHGIFGVPMLGDYAATIDPESFTLALRAVTTLDSLSMGQGAVIGCHDGEEDRLSFAIGGADTRYLEDDCGTLAPLQSAGRTIDSIAATLHWLPAPMR
jgi:hypothetical protein